MLKMFYMFRPRDLRQARRQPEPLAQGGGGALGGGLGPGLLRGRHQVAGQDQGEKILNTFLQVTLFYLSGVHVRR